MSQYNEPWQFIQLTEDPDEPYEVFDAVNHYCIASGFRYDAVALSEEYMERVVRCINACAGIPNEVLEQTIAMNENRRQQGKATAI
jgi:hypothetical protein